jgi:hypothetical protein
MLRSLFSGRIIEAIESVGERGDGSPADTGTETVSI